MAAKLRMTSDAQLVTVEAIQNRIDSIIREHSGILNTSAANRINALRLRLPASPFAAVGPAVNPALLLKKGDEEWGDRNK